MRGLRECAASTDTCTWLCYQQDAPDCSPLQVESVPMIWSRAGQAVVPDVASAEVGFIEAMKAADTPLATAMAGKSS